MKNIGLKDTGDVAPDGDTGLLTGWLNRTDLARELTLSVDTLQRWETRRMGPPCVRVGRKVLYRMSISGVIFIATGASGQVSRIAWLPTMMTRAADRQGHEWVSRACAQFRLLPDPAPPGLVIEPFRQTEWG